MKSFITIPVIQGNKLQLNFSSVGFLQVFDINELFFHIVANHSFLDFEVIGNTSIVGYLERINFFFNLEKLIGITRRKESPYTGDQARLHELKIFRYKPDFESTSKKMYSMFIDIGLSGETSSILVSTLSEISDNAFGHNLGRWPFKTGPMIICLIQQYHASRESAVSLLDFGVGFFETLKDNYPDIKTEHEAVHLAIQSNVTGRIGKKGGNGLTYLQKNIFNGFAGELEIRSGNCLVRIEKSGSSRVIEDNLPFTFGAHVGFKIHY